MLIVIDSLFLFLSSFMKPQILGMHENSALATLESGIDVGQGINVGPGKFAKKNKRRALNKRRASKF